MSELENRVLEAYYQCKNICHKLRNPLRRVVDNARYGLITPPANAIVYLVQGQVVD